MPLNRNQYKSLTESVVNAVDPLSEGAVKNAMWDYIEDLPKAAVSEIKGKHGKELAKESGVSSSTRKSIHGILKQNGVKPLMGSHRHGVDAISMMFHGIHGDLKEAVASASGDPNRGREGRKKPIVPPGIDPYGMVRTTLGKTHKRISKLGPDEKKRYYENIGMRSRAASKGGKTGRLYPMHEEVNPTVAEVSEAILAGDSARRSMLLRRRKEAQKILKDRAVAQERGWLPPVAKMITDVPLTVDPKKRLKPRQTDKRGIVGVKKPDFATPEDAVKHNTKVAHDIIAAIHSKPHGTPVNLYGRKRGEGTDAKERKVRVSKKRIMGQDVHVIHGTNRQVHLNPSGAGLQVIDAKSKRILLDRGNDADW